MGKKIGTTGILLFLGLTIAFQIAYYIGLRGMISNVGMLRFPTITGNLGSPCGTTPRDVADHFVCCVGLVHYFLFGYLYSVKKHYAEKSLHGKSGKIKRWVGLEIFCQLGIFFSYLLVWIDNFKLYNMLYDILYDINEEINETILFWEVWDVDEGASILYMLLCKKRIISIRSTWVEQYGDIFNLTIIIAPIFLTLLIYVIHCAFRFIQFKRSDCFGMIWAVWTVVFFLAIILLAVWKFPQMSLDGVWPWQQSGFAT